MVAKKSPGSKRARSSDGQDIQTQVLSGKDKGEGEGGTSASIDDEPAAHSVSPPPELSKSVQEPVLVLPFFCSLCLSTSTSDPVVIHEGLVPAAAYGSGPSPPGAAVVAPASPLSEHLTTACLACGECARRYALKHLVTATARLLGAFPHDAIAAADEAQMGPLLVHEFPLLPLLNHEEEEGLALTVELDQISSGPLSGACNLSGLSCPVCLQAQCMRFTAPFGRVESSFDAEGDEDNANLNAMLPIGATFNSASQAFECAVRDAMRLYVKAVDDKGLAGGSLFPDLESWREATRVRLLKEVAEATSGAGVGGSGSLRTLASATATGLAAVSALRNTGKGAAAAAQVVSASAASTAAKAKQTAAAAAALEAVILNWFTGIAESSTSGSNNGVFMPLAASPSKQRNLQNYVEDLSACNKQPTTLLARKPSLLGGGAFLRLGGPEPLSAASKTDLTGQQTAASHPPALLPTCGACEEAAGSVDCIECGFPLCEACLQSSHSKGRYKTHSVVPIGQASKQKGRKCSEHPDQTLELYCRDCKICVCVRCCFSSAADGTSRTRSSSSANSNLKSHTGHNVVPVAEVIAEIAADVSAAADKMKLWGSRALAVSIALKGTVPTIARREEAITGDIRAHFDALRADLQKAEADTIGSVKRFLSVQRDSLEQSHMLFRRAADDAEVLRATMAAITEETHPTVAVQLQAAVTRRVESATREVEAIGKLALLASNAHAEAGGNHDAGSILLTFSSLVTEQGPTDAGPIDEAVLLSALLAPLQPNVDKLEFQSSSAQHGTTSNGTNELFNAAVSGSFAFSFPQSSMEQQLSGDENTAAQKLLLWHHGKCAKEALAPHAASVVATRLSVSEMAEVADAQQRSAHQLQILEQQQQQFYHQQQELERHMVYQQQQQDAMMARHNHQQSAASTPALHQATSRFQSSGYGHGQQAPTPHYQYSTAPPADLSPSRPANRLAGAVNPSTTAPYHQYTNQYQQQEVEHRRSPAACRIGAQVGARDDDDDDSIGLMIAGNRPSGRASAGAGQHQNTLPNRPSEQAAATSTNRTSVAQPTARTTLGGIARIFQMNTAPAASPTSPQPDSAQMQQSSKRKAAGAKSPSSAQGTDGTRGVSPKSSKGKVTGGIQLHL